MSADELDRLLHEQQDYYRARAPEYLKEALVPLSRQEAAALQRDLEAAFDRHFRGDVLELACGPGTWTAILAERARSLTAVDGSAEMLALAARKTPVEHVRFLQADLFKWRPQRGYDAVFFGFWLSHVPEARFESFWSAVADALKNNPQRAGRAPATPPVATISSNPGHDHRPERPRPPPQPRGREVGAGSGPAG